MNQILKNLEAIEEERNLLQAEYDDQIEALHKKYCGRFAAIHKRLESYQLVAKELGLVDLPESDVKATENNQSIVNQGIKQVEAENRHPAQKYNMPINDAVEKVFRETGNKPMAVEQLRQEVAKLGITPSSATFRSAIAKDSKKRFEAVRRGIYRLRGANGTPINQQSNTLFDSSVEANLPITETISKDSNSKNNGFVMTEAIKKIVLEVGDSAFDADWLFDILQERYPSDINEERRKSVLATLGNISDQLQIVKIRRGKDKQPAVFQKNGVPEVVESDVHSEQVLEQAKEFAM